MFWELLPTSGYDCVPTPSLLRPRVSVSDAITSPICHERPSHWQADITYHVELKTRGLSTSRRESEIIARRARRPDESSSRAAVTTSLGL